MRQIERIMLQRMGKDLKQFKRPFLNRRISARMRTVRVQDGSEYARILESDTNEPAMLFKSFSINVTEFYRDAFVWESVAQNILPKLLQDRTGP
ncbi:MAG: chemotaxis protein CheB, partial [Candidatus Nitrosotenuis sp.]|nr:chemotaxis protein CheB [Candidatus Nitrosotenuis sp.]